jgi:hypothetical protein
VCTFDGKTERRRGGWGLEWAGIYKLPGGTISCLQLNHRSTAFSICWREVELTELLQRLERYGMSLNGILAVTFHRVVAAVIAAVSESSEWSSG